MSRYLRPVYFALGLIAVALSNPALAQYDAVYPSEHYDVRVTTVAEGFDHPWGLAFLPDGAMLVTERDPGTIRVVDPDGTVQPPLAGTPDVFSIGQGGMLDIAVDPDYATTKMIYFSYSEPGEGGGGTAVARGVLDRDANTLRGLEVLFRQHPKSQGGRHFGSRIVFSADGEFLFITVGERGERDRTQDFTINRGQIVRIHKDGRIPADNPFVGRAGYRPETWSVGHRNPQGAARHPDTGKLWINEHGARGGDEVNIPAAGKNYGWPVISYGTHYSGVSFSGTQKEGMEQPVYYWDPSIAPSGMAFYSADKFPKWRGNAFVGALKYRLLVRLEFDGERVVAEERLLEGLGKRIRAVIAGPDGYLYLLIDQDAGRVLRLSPAR